MLNNILEKLDNDIYRFIRNNKDEYKNWTPRYISLWKAAFYVLKRKNDINLFNINSFQQILKLENLKKEYDNHKTIQINNRIHQYLITLPDFCLDYNSQCMSVHGYTSLIFHMPEIENILNTYFTLIEENIIFDSLTPNNKILKNNRL